MIGCYDFCGHYDWTFAWLRKQGGADLERAYWQDAIAGDSQRHAADLIKPLGFAGMAKYWEHTLTEEAAGYTITKGENVFRTDMHRCPSRGFLLDNGISFSADYCDHCIGWIGPVMKEAGFVIDHEHNHCGQCWWEMRKAEDPTAPSEPGDLARQADVRLRENWKASPGKLDRFSRSTSVTEKELPPSRRLSRGARSDSR
jgi:hypothetical protein